MKMKLLNIDEDGIIVVEFTRNKRRGLVRKFPCKGDCKCCPVEKEGFDCSIFGA